MMSIKCQVILGRMLREISTGWWLFTCLLELIGLFAIGYGIFSLFKHQWYTAIGCIPITFLMSYIEWNVQVHCLNYYNTHLEDYSIGTRILMGMLDTEFAKELQKYKKSF